MVQINKETRQLTISMAGDAEDLQELQCALIGLLQGYNYEHRQAPGDLIYHVLNLLEALLPEPDQLKRAFVSEADNLELRKR